MVFLKYKNTLFLFLLLILIIFVKTIYKTEMNLETQDSVLTTFETQNDILQKQSLNNSIKAGSFYDLVDFWKKTFILTTMESDFNSLMSASDFMAIYQPLADQGDDNAKYLISVMANNCLAVDYVYSSSRSSAYSSKSISEALFNDYQRCEIFLDNLSERERQALLRAPIINNIFDLLIPDFKVDLDRLDLYPLGKEKILFYRQFNSGTEGVLKQPMDKQDAVFFETISNVSSPINLHAAVLLLSTQGVGDYEPFNEELTAWLLASCASGYGCNDSFSMTGGFTMFCANRNADCFNKSPEEIISVLVPLASYEEILNRAWNISQRISGGEQELLLHELLSTISPKK